MSIYSLLVIILSFFKVDSIITNDNLQKFSLNLMILNILATYNNLTAILATVFLGL